MKHLSYFDYSCIMLIRNFNLSLEMSFCFSLSDRCIIVSMRYLLNADILEWYHSTMFHTFMYLYFAVHSLSKSQGIRALSY